MCKWDATDYHQNSGNQQKWAQELILKLDLKGAEKVLDIGCGDGKVTAQIAKHLPGGSVLGIDYSKEMVCFARDSFPPGKYPSLAFKEVDARDLSFSREFDVVFSNAALHWVVDHLPVLERIKKSLKPGGKVLLQMGGKGNAAEILGLLDEIIKREKWSRYFVDLSTPYGFYGLEEYERWLKHVGLELKRLELIPKDMVHKGEEGLSAWIRTTWLPYTQRIPESLRHEFIDEIAGKYTEDHPADDEGLIHMQMVRLEVEAENI